LQNLLKIIQARKIDRIAAAYGVGAWLLVQAAGIALPAFAAPTWVLRVLIAAAIAGFPVTIWFAWHVTPPPHSRRHPAPPPSRATDIALLGMLSAVILLSAVEIAAQTGLLPGVVKTETSSKPLAPAADPAPPKTFVAVLPFTNMSGDPSKDWFSDGISEELLNQLANAPELRVAARTSSFAFKGMSEDIRNIARELSVGSVLEGSVREDGQHIRITAQLISAADGFQVWSQTYDRDLSNILQLQDEIARAITAALTHGVLGSVPPASSRAQINPDAYRLYLKAQSLSALKSSEDDSRALDLFEQVTKTQPDFAPAFAAMGRTYIHLAEFEDRRGDLVSAAETALDRALALDPRNLEALSSHLLVALMKWDWDKAAADAQRLKSINPHSVFTLRGLNSYYDSLGFPEQQAATLREATRLDPLSFVDLNNLATVYNNRGEYAEAESAANDALALRPDRVLTLYTLCTAYAGMKRANRAQILIDQMSALHATDASEGCALINAANSARKAEAHALADSIAARFPAFVFGETDIGLFYLAAGDVPRALVWFERAYAKRDYKLFETPFLAAAAPSLLKSQGWIALMKKPEARAWQSAHDRLSADLAAN
jgi:TolB-like protein/thioredoxin-like negative regulator of GroEL